MAEGSRCFTAKWNDKEEEKDSVLTKIKFFLLTLINFLYLFIFGPLHICVITLPSITRI